MNRIENLSTCTGCSSCYSICPVQAITMQQNSEGFYYPLIDQKKCIRCGRCEQVCPVLLTHEPISNEINEAYACIYKDEDIRLQSSSGGMFTVFAEQIINNGGIVFGARFTDSFSVIHDWTDTIDGLSSFRGSKYVQSSIGETYKKCKSFLDANRMVMFSGTPCQIVGLKNFLGKDYDNLFTIDVICHGVPSPLVWERYLQETEQKSGKYIEKISFRRKDCGWKRYSLVFTFSDSSENLHPQTEGKWMLSFNKNIMMRKSCYKCNAKGNNILSDITIGDFWGIENYLIQDDNMGTSIVLINSRKGLFFLQEITPLISKIKIIHYNAAKYNTQLLYSIKMNKNREKFIKHCLLIGFSSAYNKYVKQRLLCKIYWFFRRIVSKIYHCLRRII